MAIYPTFFYRQYRPGNVFDDILEPKKAFLGYINKRFKKSKNCHFSKGVNPWLRISMGWCLLRLSAKILALLRVSVNFLLLRLTKKLKINFFCFKKLNIT